MASSDSNKPAPKGTEKTKDEVLATLHNPAKDRNSGQVWPIFLLIVAVSIGWIFKDPELRRGLGQLTGFHAIEPLVEQVINREFLITVHGTYTSSCTQRVMLAAYEKDLEVEMKLVDMAAKQHKTPEHLALHPFGQIPLLEVNEETYIYESRAIAHYLERRWPKRGTSFAMGNTTTAFVYYDQALSFEAFDFDPTATAIYKEAVMKPSRTGRPVDETALQAALALFEDKMDGYERILSQRPYLAGNLTLADLYHLPLGTKIIDAGHGSALTDSKKRPHVAKWWAGLSERSSWQAVLKDVANWHDEQKREKEEREKAEASSTSSQISSASSALSTASSSISSSMKAEESGKKHHGIFH